MAVVLSDAQNVDHFIGVQDSRCGEAG